MNWKTFAGPVGIALILLQSISSVWAGPTGAPGIPHRWAPALKQAVGTAYEETGAQSPVWFTLAEGILTEVYYPNIDQAQVGDLQLLITDGNGFFSEQKRDSVSQVSFSEDGATVLVKGRDRSGLYSFEQEYITDAHSPVVRIKTTLQWNKPGMRVFVLFKPAIQNTGNQNLGYAGPEGLIATKQPGIKGYNGTKQEPVFAALTASVPWTATSAGYVGFSDGWQDLSRNFRLTQQWKQAGPGNIALTGELQTPPGASFTFELALGFGSNRESALLFAKTAMGVAFNKARKAYDQGWENYIESLLHSEASEKRFMRESSFARRSAQIIKMHEDKRNRGAIIASMSKPAIPDGDRAMDGTGGYHLVWPRDLYHAAMGLLAAGDLKTPVETLKYLKSTQNSDGSWYQNFWVNGTSYWTGLQLDEVAFPVLLAHQLSKRGIHKMTASDLEMVHRAAQFILSHGPKSPQDRWEEIGGYIPSTLASEIAALRAASQMTHDSRYQQVAHEWQAQLETWTLVMNGPHGRNYYLRVSPHGDPDGREPIYIANGGGPAYANEILDGGFLELVRYGVRRADDANIVSTLKAYESPSAGIAEGNPNSDGALTYRRYNRDAYGHQRVGGFWPLLAGERGHYALAAGDFKRARAQLFMLESAALPSGVLPEQTVSGADRPPAGGGVATPLVWAHAEDLRLHRSLEEGVVFDAP